MQCAVCSAHACTRALSLHLSRTQARTHTSARARAVRSAHAGAATQISTTHSRTRSHNTRNTKHETHTTRSTTKPCTQHTTRIAQCTTSTVARIRNALAFAIRTRMHATHRQQRIIHTCITRTCIHAYRCRNIGWRVAYSCACACRRLCGSAYA
jgi:hypothetical protein